MKYYSAMKWNGTLMCAIPWINHGSEGGHTLKITYDYIYVKYPE
jgi:hypothetical protein